MGTRLALAVALLCLCIQDQAAPAGTVSIVSSGRITPPVKHALSRVRAAVAKRGQTTRERRELSNDGDAVFVIGTTTDDLLTATLAAHDLSLPEKAGSLLIATVTDHVPPLVVIAGQDERGLTYALCEVAWAIETGPQNVQLSRLILNTTESPFLTTRSLQMQIFNEDLERDWYFDEDYWRGYFSMLVVCRYNNFTLTFGHQTNYMNPAYAWLVHVFQYPDIRVKGVTNVDRRRNLRMLERISRLAWEYGLDFTLGVWTQQPVEKYGPSSVETFPKGNFAADYCAHALKFPPRSSVTSRFAKSCCAIGVWIRQLTGSNSE